MTGFRHGFAALHPAYPLVLLVKVEKYVVFAQTAQLIFRIGNVLKCRMIKATRTKKRAVNYSKMSDEILRYTDLAALIQMAKSRGWPTERIVREMSGGLPHAEAMNLARKAAPLLDITVSEFMRLRKNE